MTGFRLAPMLAAVLAVSACASSHLEAPNQATDGTGQGAAVDQTLAALAVSEAADYMTRQHHALEKRLAIEQARGDLYITRIGTHALRVGIFGDHLFSEDSVKLSSAAKRTLSPIAEVFRQFEKTIVHIVGHTDSRGTAAYNQTLSERRAGAVASYLAKQGVSPARVMTWGRGESEPIASNDTQAGRARNRRVDIVIKPIIEGDEQKAFLPPPYLGS